MEIVSKSYLSLLLKGKFTFPEAKKVFAETADIFEKGVTEPNAAKRVDIAKEIFEKSRHLWQEQAEQEKALQELAKMFSDLGKSAMSGSGHGQDGDPSSVSPSKKDKRRKVTVKKVSKEEMEELKKNSGSESGPIPEDADVTVYVCDEEDKEEKAEEEKGEGLSVPSSSDKKDEKSENEESSGSSTPNDSASKEDDEAEETAEESSSSSEGEQSGEYPDGESNNDGEGEGKGEETKDDSSEEKSSPPNSKDNSYKPTSKGSSLPASQPSTKEENEEEIEDGDCSIDEDEYQIDADDLDRILAEVERDSQEVKKEAEEQVDNSEIPNHDISSAKMPQKSCLNYRVTFGESQRSSLETAYAKTLEKMAIGIHTTTKALKRIFEDDKEEREYRSSGKVSLKRLYGGTITDRIFEKKISPAEKSDLAVEILVDESGSMDISDKYVAARECCIALAEIFNKLNVPVYVIGFTADTMGYDVVHSHYITWKNTKDDRLKLLNISARCDNCDGASIRYATEIIKKKQAKNKLLIVISDGRPAAYNYSMGEEDTKDAVRLAKKHTSVLGVAVGNNDTEKIQFFYEKDFLHVSNVDELFSGIAKSIKKIIKTWR